MSKPHIVPLGGGGLWLCTGVNARPVAVGVGCSPRQAYHLWLDNYMTEVMRVSHPHMFVTRNPPVRLSNYQLYERKL